MQLMGRRWDQEIRGVGGCDFPTEPWEEKKSKDLTLSFSGFSLPSDPFRRDLVGGVAGSGFAVATRHM